MPSHEETSECVLAELNNPKINLTDLSIGKTELSPAFSRLRKIFEDHVKIHNQNVNIPLGVVELFKI